MVVRLVRKPDQGSRWWREGTSSSRLCSDATHESTQDEQINVIKKERELGVVW